MTKTTMLIDNRNPNTKKKHMKSSVEEKKRSNKGH
jgi:hypothetical protein